MQTALKAGAALTDVFVSPRFVNSANGAELMPRLHGAGISPIMAKDHVLQRMSDTKTSQGVVAVARMQPFSADLKTFPTCTGLVVADSISDPGNLGTIVRSAAAVTACLWTSAGSTDLYDPKALRASVGTLFLISHAQRLSYEHIVDGSKQLGLPLVIADAKGDVRYDHFDWRSPFALVIGNEAHGVSPELLHSADAIVRVPLAPGVESLNAAVTASICLFEAERQRGR